MYLMSLISYCMMLGELERMTQQLLARGNIVNEQAKKKLILSYTNTTGTTGNMSLIC